MNDKRKQSREQKRSLAKANIIRSCTNNLKKRILNNITYEDVKAKNS